MRPRIFIRGCVCRSFSPLVHPSPVFFLDMEKSKKMNKKLNKNVKNDRGHIAWLSTSLVQIKSCFDSQSMRPHSFFILSLNFLFIFLLFSMLKKWGMDQWTDGQTDEWTDRWTDAQTDGLTDRRRHPPSYRDARTHLKTGA